MHMVIETSIFGRQETTPLMQVSSCRMMLAMRVNDVCHEPGKQSMVQLDLKNIVFDFAEHSAEAGHGVLELPHVDDNLMAEKRHRRARLQRLRPLLQVTRGKHQHCADHCNPSSWPYPV